MTRISSPPGSKRPPGFPWQAFLAVLSVGALAVGFVYVRSLRAPAIGWAIAGDGADEPTVVHAGDLVRVDERFPGRVVLGPIDLRLAPGAEVVLASETEARLTRGSLDVVSTGGRRFAIGAAGAPPLFVLPESVARAAVALGPEGLAVTVSAGLFELGPLRVGPGERALARPGLPPEKVQER